MTDTNNGQRSATAVAAGLKRRYAAERRFQVYGIAAIAFALACLVILFGTIISKGIGAFSETVILIDVELTEETVGGRSAEAINDANYRTIVRKAMQEAVPGVKGRRDRRTLLGMVSSGAAFQLRDMLLDAPDLIGGTVPVWVVASDDIDQFHKGVIRRDLPEADRRVKDKEIAWYDVLAEQNRIGSQFNWTFLTSGDLREPEQAGLLGAMVGSALTMLVTLILSFPVGVASAVYLEEFAPKNRWTQLIEVNINNLAAVPSIVFGLLGLAVFLNFMELPRSAPLVGGMVLALMTLPTIIIAGRAALKSVPPSICEAALGLGASPMQVVGNHVLPLAMPGMLTGAIIGMARALGETAPLLMIGMVAFIVDIPAGLTDPSTVLPVQVYLWADSPERAFIEKTSAATLVLLVFLVAMNALAVLLRKKFERRW